MTTRQAALQHLADTYHNGDMDAAKKYVVWVVETYGTEQEIRAGPPGVIYGKAGDLMNSWTESSP